MADPQTIIARMPDGTVLRFPAGTPDAAIDAEVRRVHDESMATKQGSPAPWDMAASTIGHVGTVAGHGVARLVRAAVNPENAPTVGGIIGGLAAAPFTGGMSFIPALATGAAAAGVGGMLGAGVKQQAAQGPHLPTTTDVKDAAVEGGKQAAMEVGGALVGRGVAALKPVAENVASKMMGKVLKVGPVLRRQNIGVDIPLEAAWQGATISKSGLENQSERVRGLVRKIDEAIAASDATIQPSKAGAPLATLLRDREALGPVAAADVPKIREALASFVAQDQPIPATMANEQKRYLGERLNNRFGAASTSPIAADIAQAQRIGLKKAIADAVPEVGPLNAELGKSIAVRKALEARLPTAENTNLIPARTLFGAANGNLLALASHLTGAPVLMSKAAGQTYRFGQALPWIGERIEQAGPTLLRAALLAQMKGADQEPQP